MDTKELIERLLEYRSLNDKQITYQLPHRWIRGIIDKLEELEELRRKYDNLTTAVRKALLPR